MTDRVPTSGILNTRLSNKNMTKSSSHVRQAETTALQQSWRTVTVVTDREKAALSNIKAVKGRSYV